MQHRRNYDVIVETLAPQGKHIIDVGCGDGGLARLLAKHGATVLGVECSPRQLAKARAAKPVEGVTIVEGVGQDLPAPDGSAHALVFFNSLHHVPAELMGQALAEAARVLMPDGLVYVSEPVAEGLFFETCRPVDDETQVRAQAYEALKTCPKLEIVQEIRFLHTLVMADYAAFRERIVSANSEREARFDQLDAQMRALFERNGTRTEDGHSFAQPMRVNVLRPRR